MTAEDGQPAAHGGGNRQIGEARQWNSEELLAGWRAAGGESGMHLIVHSALSSLGRVCGGAASVVDSLRRAVGAAGTLVVPAFTPQVADPHSKVRGIPDVDVRARRDSFLHHAESRIARPRLKQRRFPMLVDGERVWCETLDVGDDNDTYFPVVGRDYECHAGIRPALVGHARTVLLPACGFVPSPAAALPSCSTKSGRARRRCADRLETGIRDC